MSELCTPLDEVAQQPSRGSPSPSSSSATGPREKTVADVIEIVLTARLLKA